MPRSKVLVAIAAAVLMSVPTAAAQAAPAPRAQDAEQTQTISPRKPKTRCVRGSGASRGTCYTVKRTRYKITPVESVPLRNRSRHKATMNCGFSTTITRSIQETAGMSSTGEVNAVFGLAKISVTASLSRSVTQTASQATTAGGSIVLKPGQKVVCVRTYGHVVFTVKRLDYFPGGKTTTRTFKTKIPSSLGVDLRS